MDYREVSTIIKDFIKTYFENSGCKTIVIGLSGGIDSAVTAILCKQALGKTKVKCLFLPDETTSESDRVHHDVLVKKFDFDSKIIDITPLVKDFTKYCPVKPDELGLANIKARIRMTVLFSYANMNCGLVCGTSNKSELLIGYFTKYGDGGVDLMPIGDLYKTQVFELARFLKIPEEICCKPPSAGLIKGQTDERELKINYSALDKILLGLEHKYGLECIVKTFNVDKKDVLRVQNMRKSSQHKRRSPLIPKIGLRTPGYDWRSPTQEG